MTDEQLLRSGNFREIVSRHETAMRRIGHFYGLDFALAEDAAQDAFLELVQQRASVLRVKQFLFTAVATAAARFKRVAA